MLPAWSSPSRIQARMRVVSVGTPLNTTKITGFYVFSRVTEKWTNITEGAFHCIQQDVQLLNVFRNRKGEWTPSTLGPPPMFTSAHLCFQIGHFGDLVNFESLSSSHIDRSYFEVPLNFTRDCIMLRHDVKLPKRPTGTVLPHVPIHDQRNL